MQEDFPHVGLLELILSSLFSGVEGEESDDGAALDYIQNLAAADDSEDLPEDSKVCCHPQCPSQVWFCLSCS